MSVAESREPLESDIELILREGGAAIAAASSTEALAQVETDLFGKRSALSGAHRAVGSLEPEQRKEAGRRLHERHAVLSVAIGLIDTVDLPGEVLADREAGRVVRGAVDPQA